uniref:Uncharacterized protein n=1 Tax=Prevotella sp. GTC17254 TaxID=3236794 RepID=A0AB33J6P9_9BACT
MKTLSIRKDKTLSVAEAVKKWWNSKNVFFSTLSEDEFTNKEVVLIHLFLTTYLICIVSVETYPMAAILAMGLSAGCVRSLNKGGNQNY